MHQYAPHPAQTSCPTLLPQPPHHSLHLLCVAKVSHFCLEPSTGHANVVAGAPQGQQLPLQLGLPLLQPHVVFVHLVILSERRKKIETKGNSPSPSPLLLSCMEPEKETFLYKTHYYSFFTRRHDVDFLLTLKMLLCHKLVAVCKVMVNMAAECATSPLGMKSKVSPMPRTANGLAVKCAVLRIMASADSRAEVARASSSSSNAWSRQEIEADRTHQYE